MITTQAESTNTVIGKDVQINPPGGGDTPSEEESQSQWLKVEAALAEGRAQEGNFPPAGLNSGTNLGFAPQGSAGGGMGVSSGGADDSEENESSSTEYWHQQDNKTEAFIAQMGDAITPSPDGPVNAVIEGFERMPGRTKASMLTVGSRMSDDVNDLANKYLPFLEDDLLIDSIGLNTSVSIGSFSMGSDTTVDMHNKKVYEGSNNSLNTTGMPSANLSLDFTSITNHGGQSDADATAAYVDGEGSSIGAGYGPLSASYGTTADGSVQGMSISPGIGFGGSNAEGAITQGSSKLSGNYLYDSETNEIKIIEDINDDK